MQATISTFNSSDPLYICVLHLQATIAAFNSSDPLYLCVLHLQATIATFNSSDPLKDTISLCTAFAGYHCHFQQQ